MVFKLTFFTRRRQSRVYNRCERMDIAKTPKDDRVRTTRLSTRTDARTTSRLVTSKIDGRTVLERYRQEHCKREQESRRPPVDEDEIDGV